MKKLILMIANDLRIILGLYVASILISAYFYHLFEGKTYFDGIWWACVTAPTVGYGDLSAATVPGRLMAIFFMSFWTFFMLPMLIGNVVMRLLQDKEKFTHAEQEWQEQSLKTIAKAVGAELEPSPRDF
jgi:voltage-gated potassium channel